VSQIWAATAAGNKDAYLYPETLDEMTTLLAGYQGPWTPPTNPQTWQEQPSPQQTSFHQQTDQDDDGISDYETDTDNQSVASNTNRNRTNNLASTGRDIYSSSE